MREAVVTRNTNETKIEVRLDLDGTGEYTVDTGVGFFDHMLAGFARHGFFNLAVKVDGDLEVDEHHTVEDTGIALGSAIREALGDKSGIRRFGSCILPMDETLALAAIDLSGRPYFAFDADFSAERCGTMGTQMIREFFYAVSYAAGMNLHLKILDGINDHHKAEALFKAFGRALDEAAGMDPRVSGILSTKGMLQK